MNLLTSQLDAVPVWYRELADVTGDAPHCCGTANSPTSPARSSVLVWCRELTDVTGARWYWCGTTTRVEQIAAGKDATSSPARDAKVATPRVRRSVLVWYRNTAEIADADSAKLGTGVVPNTRRGRRHRQHEAGYWCGTEYTAEVPDTDSAKLGTGVVPKNTAEIADADADADADVDVADASPVRGSVLVPPAISLPRPPPHPGGYKGRSRQKLAMLVPHQYRTEMVPHQHHAGVAPHRYRFGVAPVWYLRLQ